MHFVYLCLSNWIKALLDLLVKCRRGDTSAGFTWECSIFVNSFFSHSLSFDTYMQASSVQFACKGDLLHFSPHQRFIYLREKMSKPFYRCSCRKSVNISAGTKRWENKLIFITILSSFISCPETWQWKLSSFRSSWKSFKEMLLLSWKILLSQHSQQGTCGFVITSRQNQPV